jgi:hypothetical protein
MGSLHHHQDRHTQKHGLDERMQVEVGDAHEDRAENLIVEQPGDKEVEALKAVEANLAIVAEAVAGQDDERGDPADAGDVAENRRRARVKPFQWVGLKGRAGWRRAGVGVGGLASATASAVAIGRAHLVPALIAKRHPYLHTLFLSGEFRQVLSAELGRARGEKHLAYALLQGVPLP